MKNAGEFVTEDRRGLEAATVPLLSGLHKLPQSRNPGRMWYSWGTRHPGPESPPRRRPTWWKKMERASYSGLLIDWRGCLICIYDTRPGARLPDQPSPVLGGYSQRVPRQPDNAENGPPTVPVQKHWHNCTVLTEKITLSAWDLPTILAHYTIYITQIYIYT